MTPNPRTWLALPGDKRLPERPVNKERVAFRLGLSLETFEKEIGREMKRNMVDEHDAIANIVDQYGLLSSCPDWMHQPEGGT